MFSGKILLLRKCINMRDSPPKNHMCIGGFRWLKKSIGMILSIDILERSVLRTSSQKVEPELDGTNEGILKETEEIESPEIDLPTTEDSVVEEVNIDQLANYPPLIPTEPNLISLESSSLKNRCLIIASPSDSFAQAAAIAAMDRHNPQTNSGATSNSHLLPRGNIESSSRAVDRSGSGTPDSFPDFHTSFMPANSNSPLDLFYIPLAFISFLNEFVEALVFGSPTTAQRRAAERIRQRARELDGNSRRHHPRSWNVVN